MSCGFCEIFSETVTHCLATCEYVKDCWHTAGCDVDGITTESHKESLEEMLCMSDEQGRKKVMVIC